ncbi:hypothetical protein V8C37DRAFT_409123 [Trichoderma ceciliae]
MGTESETSRFGWKTILLCTIIVTLASRQFTKLIPAGFSSSQPSTDHQWTSRDPRRPSNAHVVIRPNPQVVGINLLHYASRAWTILPEDANEVESTNKQAGPESRKILHDSFDDIDQNRNKLAVAPYGNGLVNGIIRAFQQDLHLILRPDDIWLAITVQFSFYINAHAEEMRSFFVSHQGQKELTINMGSMGELDVGLAARLFADLVQENVVDPELERWILPNFSTTTANDTYFQYSAIVGCGFPSVTLLGERDDWVDLLERVLKLARFSSETAEWSVLLSKVVEKMIEAYDRPEATEDFWMKAVHRTGWEASGLGLESLSGWITAFCFWSEEGFRVHQYSDEELQRDTILATGSMDRKRLAMGGVSFPIIHAEAVPQAVVEVPVKVIDLAKRLYYETTIIAGSVGMTATASENRVEYDTFQPRSGWWMLLDKSGPLGESLGSE